MSSQQNCLKQKNKYSRYLLAREGEEEESNTVASKGFVSRERKEAGEAEERCSHRDASASGDGELRKISMRGTHFSIATAIVCTKSGLIH